MYAATHHVHGTGFAPDPRQLTRVAAGIAISLALHALLLSMYRQPQPALISTAPEPLTVRLRPAAPPVPAPVPKPEAQTIPRQHKPAPTARRTRPARPVIAVPPATRLSAEETSTVDPAPAAAPPDDTPSATPTLDIKAARSLAYRLAREPDPTRAGTALERLPPPPLQTETRAARAIGAARRADCKDGIPGGVLAPLYLMMDKKDSGCKW